MLEGEVQNRESEIKRITFGLSAIQADTSTSILHMTLPSMILAPKDMSKSPNRQTQLVKPNKIKGVNEDNLVTPVQQSKVVKNSIPDQPKRVDRGGTISNVNVSNVPTQQIQLNVVTMNQNQITRSSLEEQQILSTKGSSVQFTEEDSAKEIKPLPLNLNKKTHSRSRAAVSKQAFMMGSNRTTGQGLSIDYRDNDPQFYNIEDNHHNQKIEKRNLKNSAIRKIKSGENFDFLGIISEKTKNQTLQDSSNFQRMSQDTDAFFRNQDSHSTMYGIQKNHPQNNDSFVQNETQSQSQQPFQYSFSQEKEQVKNILKFYKKQNLGFSKFKIISIDGEGKLERIKLKIDPIRIAQREFFSKMRKLRQNNKKEKAVAKSVQFTENDLSKQGFHQIQPSHMLRKESYFEAKYQNLQIVGQDDYDDERVIIENEEDAIDCQEGNKTPFNHYSMSGKRPRVQFQNNEVMMFQSPRHAQKQLFLDDEIPVQTHRVLEDDFEDQMLLETPVHRIVSNNESKEYDTWRAKQKQEYSNDEIMQMQMSIRNISTNKKQNRRQMPGQVIPGQSDKLDRKNLESFRADNTIKEEAISVLSEDEQELLADSKDKSVSIGLGTSGEHRLIKNPTYTRITHASKQMGFPGPFRLGTTMGYRNNDHHLMNPMMKSMPNLDFLKQKDKTSSLPFDEISGIEKDVTHQHTSTLFEINNTTYINPIVTNKLQPFASPQNNKTSRFQQICDSPPKSGKPNKIFEEFFIIGVDSDEVSSLDWTKSDQNFLAPQTLYMYNKNIAEDCERRRVVKDFCFPDGIEVKQEKKPGDSRSKIISKAQKILYSSKSVRDQCFVFTMNANDEAASENSQNYLANSHQQLETFPGGGSQDKYYSCLCVVFSELICSNKQRFSDLRGKELERKFKESRVFSTKKAYCFMFSNAFYQLHLDVLNLLINALKYERLKISQDLQMSDPTLIDQTFTDILSMLDLPLRGQEMLDILNKYNNLDFEDLSYGMPIVITIGQDIGCIKYDVPSVQDLPYLDCHWFCPTLFSLFSLDNLLKLISAVLVEKSLVFIGRQSLLSSAILGLNSLLYPFKWCLALVPILPHPLIEMLEAPLPILVGITKREYQEVTLTQDEKDSKIWAFLETGQIIWNKDGLKVPMFSFDCRQEIDYEYSRFKKTFEAQYTSASGLDSDRSSSVSEIDNSQIFNEEVKYNCRRICEIIRKSLKQYILNSLKCSKKKRSISTTSTFGGDNFVKEMGDLVLENGRPEDREFLKQFVETQMFATYVEENMKTISNFHTYN